MRVHIERADWRNLSKRFTFVELRANHLINRPAERAKCTARLRREPIGCR
jgi:hypothetical protein